MKNINTCPGRIYIYTEFYNKYFIYLCYLLKYVYVGKLGIKNYHRFLNMYELKTF